MSNIEIKKDDKQKELICPLSNLTKLIDCNFITYKNYLEKLPEDLKLKVIEAHCVLCKEFKGYGK